MVQFEILAKRLSRNDLKKRKNFYIFMKKKGSILLKCLVSSLPPPPNFDISLLGYFNFVK